ncbi:MAG TPA: BCCT family transporter [Alcanivoracaceae bacterium]|nr:BCCT family transporter [Alcanivoracaceae bacterium]
MFAKNRVFVISASLIFMLVLVGAFVPEQFGYWAGKAQRVAGQYFGWLYLASIFFFILFLLYLAFGKYGKVRLGAQDSTPEFSFFSWMNMLMSAGFGVGLVFYGMAEPMIHYLDPPHQLAEAGTAEAMNLAMQYTYFHWGLSQWVAFAVVGLIVAFFQFRKDRAGLVSNMVEPVLRNVPVKMQEPMLNSLDVLAVVATVIGMATSIGLGVLQVNGGLTYVFGFGDTVKVKLLIMLCLFSCYMLSSLTGLDKGIKILSNFNMALAFLFLGYLLVVGPTVFILETFVHSLGGYLSNFVNWSLTVPPQEDGTWMNQWTFFLWAWVIAWSPFVGTFIARISRGRTIQEYVFGVLIVPPLLACMWIAIVGGSAFHMEMNGVATLAANVQENMTHAMFDLYSNMKFSMLLSIITLMLVFTFLVTSADSASYIVSQMTDHGSLNPPLYKRITWGVLLSAICLTLLATGGLGALQTASLLVAVPFIVVLFIMAWVLMVELAEDRRLALYDLYHQNEGTPVGADIYEADEIGTPPVEERIKRRMVLKKPRLK